jgi:hypothetical protein
MEKAWFAEAVYDRVNVTTEWGLGVTVALFQEGGFSPAHYVLPLFLAQ